MKLAAPNRIAAYFLPIGRIGGAAWFIRNLLNLIALGLLAALISDFKSSYTETLLGVLGFVWIYLTVITAAKRFHDLNLTGWLAPLVFVPVAPLFLLILSGTKGSNKYGIYPGTAQSERTSAITTRIIFLLAGLGLIASIIVLACTQTLKNSGSRYFSTLKPPVSDTHYGQTSKELFIKTGPRIVMLESFSASGQGILQGSGVILGPTLSGAKDGYYRLNTGTDILTNHHVVKNSDHVVITTKDGEKHLAAVIFFDEQADLALLRAPLESSLKPIIINSSVAVGEPIFTISNPKGLGWSFSQGIISRLPEQDNALIQFSASISSGSSGGGLFDASGDLVGIITGFLTDSQNLNFAILISKQLQQQIDLLRLRAAYPFSSLEVDDWCVGSFISDDPERGSQERYAEWNRIRNSYSVKRQALSHSITEIMEIEQLSFPQRESITQQKRKEFYFDNQDFFKSWKEAFPNDSEAAVEQIQMLIAPGKKSDAQNEIASALDNFPLNIELVRIASHFLIENDRADAAADILAKISEKLKGWSDVGPTFSDGWSKQYFSIKKANRDIARRQIVKEYNRQVDVFSRAGYVSPNLKVE